MVDLFKSKFPSVVSSKLPFHLFSGVQGGAAASSLNKLALALLRRAVGGGAQLPMMEFPPFPVPQPCCENTPLLDRRRQSV